MNAAILRDEDLLAKGKGLLNRALNRSRSRIIRSSPFLVMKASLDLSQEKSPATRSFSTTRKLLLAVLAGASALYYLHGICGSHRERIESPTPTCPQVESRVPSKHVTLLEDLNALYDTSHFKDTIVRCSDSW